MSIGIHNSSLRSTFAGTPIELKKMGRPIKSFGSSIGNTKSNLILDGNFTINFVIYFRIFINIIRMNYN